MVTIVATPGQALGLGDNWLDDVLDRAADAIQYGMTYSFTPRGGGPTFSSSRIFGGDGVFIEVGWVRNVTERGQQQFYTTSLGASYGETVLYRFTPNNFGFSYDGFIANLRNSTGLTYQVLAGEDTIAGSAFGDYLLGYAGNDTIAPGLDADYVDGGIGYDTVSYAGGSAGVSVSLALGFAVDSGGSTDTLAGIEAVIGTQHADVIGGDAGNNLLQGGAGNDTLYGGEGDDTLDGGVGIDQMFGGAGNDTYRVDYSEDVIVELAGNGVDRVEAAFAFVLPENVENLFLGGAATFGAGNALDNALIGNELDNVLSGGAGNDELSGGLGSDTMIGGTGSDTYYVDTIYDTLVELAGDAGFDRVFASVSYVLPDHVEQLVLVGAATTAIGNTGANTLTGSEIGNVLSGGAGNDILSGGGGPDDFIYRSGYGDDRILDFSPGDVIGLDASLAEDFAAVQAAAQQVGADTVIDFGFGTLTLQGVLAASLSASDFQFS